MFPVSSHLFRLIVPLFCVPTPADLHGAPVPVTVGYCEDQLPVVGLKGDGEKPC